MSSMDAYTTSADMCAQELREWQQQESNVALLELHAPLSQILLARDCVLF